MWTDRRLFRQSVVPLWEVDVRGLQSAVASWPSGADLAAHFDGHPGLLLEAARSMSLVDVNESALRLFEADGGENLSARMHSDPDAPGLEICRRLMAALVEGRREIRFETSARTPGGRELFLLIQALLPAAAEPSPTAIVGMIDVTDRKRMEKLLRETEMRFAEIIDFLPDATFAINADGVVTAWNHAIEEMTGASARQMIGKGNYEYAIPFYGTRRPILVDLVRLPDEQIEREYGKGLRRQEGMLIADTWIPDLLGKNTFLWGKASLLVDGMGRVTGAIESIRDITDRVHEQEELRASEERYRFFVESAFDALTISENGILIDVTPQTLRLLGYRLEEMIGRHSVDFAIPVDQEAIRRKSQDRDERAYESRLVRSDGSFLHVEMRSKHFVFRGRDVRVTAIRDITDRLHAEEALRNLQKLDSLATLAGGIAHDFNNQLSGIMGNISLAMEGLGEEGDRRQLLREAEESCRVARSLTRQLLTFASGGEPVRQVEDVGKILREQAVFAARGTSVKCLYQDGGVPLYAMVDPQQIRQVVQNLVINAVQAMPEGGVVRVGGATVDVAPGAVPLLAAGRYVELTVADEGEGIPADRLDRIFDPFYSTKAKGRGLGLAVCHSIVGRHNGRISVRSTPGRGSVFTVLLPAATDAVPERKGGESMAQGTLSGRVLVMDDEEIVSRVLARMLSRLGFQAVTVTDGAAAVAEYERARADGNPYALVVMDMTVPGGMGGKEAIAKLRELDPAVRAIVSSGYSESADYRSYGFLEILAKPYTVADLKATLDRALERAIPGPRSSPSS